MKLVKVYFLCFFSVSRKQKKRHRHKKKNSLEEKIKKTRTKIHQVKVKKSHNMINQPFDSSTSSENEVEEDSPKEEKSLLEMLELEMRRRAIRALLDKEVNQENDGIEKPTQSTEKVSTKKPDDSSKKITPVKHFRKKKQKNDDVIVIVPKLVTIDLTNDSKQSKVDSKKDVNEQNNVEVEDLINSFQINTYEKNNRNSETSEECSNTSETKSDVEVEGRKLECIVTDEVIDIPDSPELNKTQDKAEKEQPNKDETQSGKKEQPNSNWALRWLDSKDVKKVVSTSKICGNIRKKIKSAKLAKKAKENLPKDVVETPEIHGSVVEYQSLPKSSITLNMTNETANGNNAEDNNKSSQVEEIKEHQVIINIKEPTLVVEQVQDVSSTKSEISAMTNTKDHIIMSNVQVNETPTSNSDDVLTEKGDDSQAIENLESIPIKVQISESNIIDTTNSKSSLLLETDTTSELINESEIISNSQVVNTCDGNVKNASTSNNELNSGVANNLGSEQVQSDQPELNNMATNAPSFNEFENSIPCLHDESPDDELDNVKSDITIENEPSSYLDLNNKTSNTKIILNQYIPSCNAKKSSITESRDDSTEKLSPDLSSAAQEIGNEPEALEIYITEEDREIE